MSYLEGKKIKIDTPTLKSLIGSEVIYLLESDIDRSGRGYFFPRYGNIIEVIRKQVDLGSGPISFRMINTIVLKNPHP